MAKKTEIDWNRIEGHMRVYTNKMESQKGKPWYKSSVSIGSADKEGEYHNFYIDIRFAGKKSEAPDSEGIHLLTINDAFLSTEFWYDKKLKVERIKPVLVVLENEILE